VLSNPAPVPIPILTTAAVLALYVLLALWQGIELHSPAYALFALLAAVACVGAVRLRFWSKYLVYLLAAALIGSWLRSIQASYALGYFRVYSMGHVLLWLAPEGVLVLLSGYCSYAVYRQFRR
jgi:hypothetical protein